MLWAHGKLRLLVTGLCNAHCPHCHNEGIEKRARHMPYDLFQQILDVVRNAREPLVTVTISGGEALLHPQLLRIVQAVRPHTPKITLATNALLLTDEVCRSLSDCGVTKIRIDLDPYRLVDREWNPAGLDENQVGSLLTLIRRHGIKPELNTVLTAYNMEQLRKLLRFCQRYQAHVKCFQRVLAHPRLNGGAPVLAPATDVPREVLERAVEQEFGAVSIMRDDVLNSGDRAYECPTFNLRYCEFLCTYQACGMSGTRFDPQGRLSTCINGLHGDRVVPGEALTKTIAKIEAAVQRGCCATTMALPQGCDEKGA